MRHIPCKQIQETQRTPNRANNKETNQQKPTPPQSMFELQKFKRERENLEAAGRRWCTPERKRLRITADFFIRHHGSKKVRKWHLYIAERRKKPFQPRILHPAKISFKSRRRRKKKEKLLRQTIIEGIYCLQDYAIRNDKGNCLVRRNMV